jgi:hypothetical protein
MALPLAYAPEPVFGAGAASTAGGGVVRAGGLDAAGKPASTVSFSLGCGSACTPAPAGPVVPLTAARAFAANTETLIVGRSELAHTAAYLLSEKSLEAMPLRQPRSGAVAVAIPAIEEIAIVGGVLDDGSIADTLEFFVH